MELDKLVSVDSKSSNLIGRVDNLSLRETIKGDSTQNTFLTLQTTNIQISSPVKLSANRERILSCFCKELSWKVARTLVEETKKDSCLKEGFHHRPAP